MKKKVVRVKHYRAHGADGNVFSIMPTQKEAIQVATERINGYLKESRLDAAYAENNIVPITVEPYYVMDFV
jgi:hypothetical protein